MARDLVFELFKLIRRACREDDSCSLSGKKPGERKTDAARGSRDDGDFILDLHGGILTCWIKIEVFNQRAGLSRKLYPAISLQMRLCYCPRLDELREQRDIALSDFDRSNRPNRHFGFWPHNVRSQLSGWQMLRTIFD